jgi:hypothetical protein
LPDPFRTPDDGRSPLVFGATSVCPACSLRFSPRKTCPACNDTRVVSLATRDGRETYAYRVRGGTPFAPTRPWLTFGIGVLLLLPALIGRVMFGPTAFQRMWIMTDGSIEYDGLSQSGLGVLGLAAAGAALVLLTVLTRGRGKKAAEKPRLVVHSPRPADEDVVTGVARAGTIEITSPVSQTTCLAFGLRGATPEADLADAEGGDFDIELQSGERVLVSLEHAVLIADSQPGKDVVVDDELAEYLENRGITADKLALDEVVLREGDVVTVSGLRLGASVATAGGQRARVLAGDEARPLAVKISS